MRLLTIVLVSYPLAPVGPDAVGGSEQVLSALDHALVAAGHRSVVVACEGSVVAGRHVSYPAFPPDRPIDDVCHEERRAWIAERLDEVLTEERVDLVHMHGLDFHHYLPAPGVPVLATLHLPASWYPAHVMTPERPLTWVHGVSQSQAATIPAGAHVLPPIPNGVPVTRLAGLCSKRCHTPVMLARACPEKGLHLALQAAHQARCGLLLGGEVFPYEEHQSYFREEVAPLLDRRRRWLGPVSFARKRRMLSAARCLLVPSLVAETSSLVAMEAAACGTPVVAFRTGALPEVVEDGVTGFLVNDAAAMADAIGRVDLLHGDAIRAVARQRFTHERMAADYIARYTVLTRIADRSSLAA